MSQLVPFVLLLAVEVLLGCVDVQCWIQLVSQVGSLCIITGSRGPAGVCRCSSAGFS